jgi:hypothetical protein
LNVQARLSAQTRAMRRADVQAAPSEATAAASANADARSDSDLPAHASLPTASASSSSNTTGRPRRRPKETRAALRGRSANCYSACASTPSSIIRTHLNNPPSNRLRRR